MGDLHVAASADLMLNGDKRDAVLALEEAVVPVEEILVEALGEPGALGLEFCLTGLKILFAGREGGHMGLDLLLLSGVGFLSSKKSRFEAFCLFHQNKFPVLECDDRLLRHLDLVA